MIRRSVLLATLCLLAAQLHANVIFQIVSQVGGTYNYELTLTNGTGDIFFTAGQQLTVTGLSGVTGDSLSGSAAGIYSTCGFTATSACFSVTSDTVLGPATGSDDNFPTFTITSTVLTTGSVNYQIQTNGTIGSMTPTNFNGMVTGPVGVASTPEPATIGMFAIGLALLCMIRRVSRPARQRKA